MTDASALLAAIRAAPDDDAPRLVYADWLDEHGQPERAEFIRVQIELARRDDPALRRREAELLAAFHKGSCGLLNAPHFRFRFDRGFIVGFGHTGVFQTRSDGVASRILRFFVDGSAIEARPGGDGWLTEPPHWFQPGHWGPRGRAYWMLGVPMEDEIPFWLSADGIWRTLFGLLHRSALLIGLENRMDDPRFIDRYEHIHFPGFRSFPET